MKKWCTIVLCAFLFTGLVSRFILPVSAQEEMQIDEPQDAESEPQPAESEPQAEESEPQAAESEPQAEESKPQAAESESQDITEPIPGDGEHPEESDHEEEDQEAVMDQPEQNESVETSEEPEGTPSQAMPGGSDSEGENLPEADDGGNGGILIQGELPVQQEKESNPEVAEAMQAAHSSLDEHIGYIADLLGMSEGYTLIEGDDNFCEALAIYAIRHGQTGNYPYGIQITGTDEFAELQSIYWSLNTVNGAKTGANAVIRITQFSGVDVYNLSGSQQDVYRKLNSEENKEKVSALLQE